MNLSERIAADLAQAMKSKQASVVDTLRMLRAAVKNAEIDKGKTLDDEGIVAVIRTTVKQLRDSIAQFESGGRQDLAEKSEAEIRVVSAYLPPELSDEEVKEAVRKAVSTVGAAGPKDFGKVMGAASAELKGRVDGTRLSGVVKDILGTL